MKKATFMAYEEVRLSGVTNMWNTSFVSELAGIDRGEVLDIIKNYDKYSKKYLKKVVKCRTNKTMVKLLADRIY